MKMGMFAVRSTGIIELKHVFCRYSIPLVLFKRAVSFVILWSTKEMFVRMFTLLIYTVKAVRD